jgi:hypothetical protein
MPDVFTNGCKQNDKTNMHKHSMSSQHTSLLQLLKNRQLVPRNSHEFVWILIDFCSNKVSDKLSFSVSVVMVLLDINKISPKGGKNWIRYTQSQMLIS